jgi:molybdopterin/thiamine biosynthesis adenylyltransferase
MGIQVASGTATNTSTFLKGRRLERARVLQVGAGGAGSAIANALLDAAIRELVLHDPNQSRRENLFSSYRG